MDTNTTILILGFAGIVLALICGFLLLKDYLQKKTLAIIQERTRRERESTEKLLKILARNGIDLNKYLSEVAEEMRGE